MASINILQAVSTFNDKNVPAFLNQNCFISEVCNHEFDNFGSITANLGSTVGIQQQYNFVPGNGLKISNQAVKQAIQHLTINQAGYVAYAVTNQERIFNLDKDSFYQKIGKAMMKSLGTKVEKSLASHADSSAIVEDTDSDLYGTKISNSGPFRFFDFTSSGLTSFQALDQMRADFISMGAAEMDHKVILPTSVYPAIVGNGLSQFALKRNDSMVHSWLVGDFGSPVTSYYRSNSLPLHVSGYAGNNNTTLTVVSTNDPTGQNVTQITVSGGGANLGLVKDGDLGYFLSASGLRALDYTGQLVTGQLVQFRAVGDVDSAGDSATIKLVCPTHTEGQGLVSTPNDPYKNINMPIKAGMQLKFLPSHRAGLLVTGNTFYAAMPALDDESPFVTSVVSDPDTNVSLRMYYGSLFGQNQKSLVQDYILGAFLTPRYCARICLPTTV